MHDEAQGKGTSGGKQFTRQNDLEAKTY